MLIKLYQKEEENLKILILKNKIINNFSSITKIMSNIKNKLNFSVYLTKKQEFDNFLDEKLDKIYPKMSQEWIDSNKVVKCECCSKFFSFFLRKHHCRACGHIFCGYCCYRYIKIPLDLIDIPKEKGAIYHYIKKVVYDGDQSLVCDDCYNKIKNLNDIKTEISICSFLCISDLYNTILINKNWYTASIHCLSKFRNIQYKQEFNRDDYNIILANNIYLKGHSIWTKISLISQCIYGYDDDLKIDYIKSDCWNLMCSRKCNRKMDIIDIIDIMYVLFSKIDGVVNDNNIKFINKIKDLVNSSSNSINEFLYCIFPYVINCFKLLKIDDISEIIIYDILCILGNSLENLKNSYIFLLLLEYNYMFTNIMDDNKDKSINKLKFLNIINIYLKKNVDEEYLCFIKDTIQLFVSIHNKKYKKEEFKQKQFIYPFNSDRKIIDIINIKEINSASNPILVTLLLDNNQEKKIIIKSEKGLRKEQIVSQLIFILQNKLIEQMIKGRIEEFDKIPTYKVLMISNKIGIIEYLNDCHTLKSISQKNYTLQNYILEHNKQDKIGNVKERFAKSLAISSCLSYILGLGDRHAGNIMISLSGQIIHIDYGYILENPIHSSIFTPIIRISSDMIDFLGGLQGEYYELFKSFIINVFDILRLYSDLITNYYHILGYENIVNWDSFKEKLEDRFLYGMNNKDIEIVLIDLIQTSSNGYGGTFMDLCNDYGSKIKSYLPLSL